MRLPARPSAISAGALGPGTFNVTVTNAGGQSAITAADQFTYIG
jgi:hypothetical protein